MKKLELKNDQRTLRIYELDIDDPRACRILGQLPEDQREQKLLNAISIGFLTFDRTEPLAEVDWVTERLHDQARLLSYRLEEKSNGVIDLIRRHFDPDRTTSLVGPFRELVERVNLQMGQKLTETQRNFEEFEKLFDPDRDGSIVREFLKRFQVLSDQMVSHPAIQQKIDALRDEMREMITQLTTRSSEQATFDAERKLLMESMPSKGIAFEDDVFEQLKELASARNDIVESVGSHAGKGTSKKGDLVYSVTDSKAIVVLELKDQVSKFSFQKIRELINDSLQNRDGHYGVFLVKQNDCLPEGIGNFHIEDEFCVVTLENLQVAMKFAIVMAGLRKRRLTYKEGPDLMFVQTNISEIRQMVEDFSGLESHCIAAERALGKANAGIRRLGANIKEKIEVVWLVLNGNLGKSNEQSE
ncbi:hypothetical protein K2X05_12980 [bacterium]|nr:hypothetical protein [bacterium]